MQATGADSIGGALNTAGESQAAKYYADNRDLFAVNPPSTYTYNDGSGGGWLDQQEAPTRNIWD